MKKKIRLGLVGFSEETHEFLDTLTEENVQITALLAGSKIGFKNSFLKDKNIKQFATINEIISSNLVDVVFVDTDLQYRPQYVKKFLENKIAVLSKAPVAITVEENQEIIKIAEKNNTLFMESIKSTLSPNFILLKNKLKEIGKIKLANICICHSFSNAQISNNKETALSESALIGLGAETLALTISLFDLPIKTSAYLMNKNSVNYAGNIVMDYLDFFVSITFLKDSKAKSFSQIIGENGTIIFDEIPKIKEVLLVKNQIEAAEEQSIDFVNKEALPIQTQKTFENLFHDTDQSPLEYTVKHFLQLYRDGFYESSFNDFTLSRSIAETLNEIIKNNAKKFD